MDPLTETHAPPGDERSATGRVTELYRAHAAGLVRVAMLMVGDQGTAEDVVQDAFFGLYRHWASLTDHDRALTYVRSSVLNGCRTVLRKKPRRDLSLAVPYTESAEASLLLAEEHREVLRALRRLPDRQREAVVLRYCAALSEEETARSMNISRGTVKSAASRGIAALSRILKEES